MTTNHRKLTGTNKSLHNSGLSTQADDDISKNFDLNDIAPTFLNTTSNFKYLQKGFEKKMKNTERN